MDFRKRIADQAGFTAWLLPFIVGIVIGAFIHGYVLSDPAPPSAIPHDAETDFKLMAEAWNAIEQRYVDRPAVKPRTMTYGAISGMVDSLGDTGHSSFLTPEMVRAERTVETGHYAGIGVEIQMKNNRVVVVAPMDGSPAQKAGVKPGDIISEVDGVDVAGLSLPEIVGKILGPARTRVNITFQDPGTGKKRTLSVTRTDIKLRSVTWSMLPSLRLAHVRIAFFSKGTSEALEKALAAAEQEGARGLILDLRNNPGGLLDMSVGVASQFLKSGAVLQEKDAQGRIRDVLVDQDVKKYDLPLAVLINAGTASASEIVAGALQDAKRARIIGEKTFGTGTVLSPVPLSDGSRLLLAVLEWLTPKGRTIWHKGIAPDVAVSLPTEGSILVPEAEKGMSAAELRATKDAQLLEAVKLLERGSS